MGVDISLPRLNVCKKILRKYIVGRGMAFDNDSVTVKLFHADASSFPNPSREASSSLGAVDGAHEDATVEPKLVFDSRADAMEDDRGKTLKRKRTKQNKSARNRENKRLRQLSKEDDERSRDATAHGGLRSKLFDYVLVDVECSTDGAMSHIKSKMKLGVDVSSIIKGKLSNASQLNTLQLKLMQNAYENLKRGAVMVYCTCSVDESQNEGVVNNFMDSHKNDKDGGEGCEPRVMPIQRYKYSIEGGIQGTARFIPAVVDEDGMGCNTAIFVCKIKKNVV